MDRRLIAPILALLVSAASVAHAQQPPPGTHHAPLMGQIDQRFRQMDRMMDEAQKAQGTERDKLLQEHMRMMREQMAAAHTLMTRMRGGGRMVPAPGSQMDNMQERLDMMQGLMEQMLKQQQLMLKAPDR